MLGNNIKKYRLLNGLSMRDLANLLGVSHQTIKKYEDDTMTPSSTRLIEIAKILKVNISDLVYSYPAVKIEFGNYRKNSQLSKKQLEGLQLLCKDEISKYIEILNLADEFVSFDKKWKFNVSNYSEIEEIALKVRKLLGVSESGPLDNLTDKLEDNDFLILEINFSENFDGFSGKVNDCSFIILSSKGYERNRFTLAHELGHLILNFKEDLSQKDKEKYCNYFASCLLMPQFSIKSDLAIGRNKLIKNISLNDVFMLATTYKVSLNAVIMRLYYLGIIDEFKKRNLFIQLSKKGLKKEQLKFVEEHPLKEKKIIFRLESENIISKKEAIKYLGVSTNEYNRFIFK